MTSPLRVSDPAFVPSPNIAIPDTGATTPTAQIGVGSGTSTSTLKSGAAGTTITFRNPADTKNRIVATVDASGNRTAITYDVTP